VEIVNCFAVFQDTIPSMAKKKSPLAILNSSEIRIIMTLSLWFYKISLHGTGTGDTKTMPHRYRGASLNNDRFKILFVEDELSLQKSIAYILEKEGFSITTARTGEEAVQLARKENPDLLLLDLMLPGIDGFEVCRILKRDPKTADIFIIMLTGKKMVEDITKGLSEFADDYITKPFEPAILIARIHAILRRKMKSCTQPDGKECMQFGPVTIDLNAREVRLNNEPIDLTKTEFDLLVLLARKPNMVFSRTQVLEYIRQDDYDITDRIVDYQVSGLRKKLGDAGRFIETVRGIGYKFKV